MKKRTLFLAMTALMITMTSGGSLTAVYADEIPTEAAETSESTELPIKPLTAKIVDENPYMAKSDSNIHHDCYNTDSTDEVLPVDIYSEINVSYEKTNPNASPAIFFDTYGHAVVPFLGGLAIRDINADETQTLGCFSPKQHDGGGYMIQSSYSFVDESNRLVCPTSNNHVLMLKATDDEGNVLPEFEKVLDIDIKAAAEEKLGKTLDQNLLSVVFDYDGNLWFATGGFRIYPDRKQQGAVGYISRAAIDSILNGEEINLSDAVFVYELTPGEGAENGISASKDGAVILTNTNCYLFQADNGINKVWQTAYESVGAKESKEGDSTTGGCLAWGSGCSPSLTKDLVMFTDNQNPVNLLALDMKTGETMATMPVIDELPEDVQVSVENSAIVYDNGSGTVSTIVCNWFGAGSANLGKEDSDSSIQSYENMRNYLYNQATIETLIQFEYSAFEEATVPVCTFAFRNDYVKRKGCYLRLVDFRGGMEVQRQKSLEAILNHKCGFYYEQSTDDFSKIPGRPVAYWVNENVAKAFDTGKTLSSVARTRQGLASSDNNRFLKLWWEPSFVKIGFGMKNAEIAKQSRRKWFPCNKGGEFRKWYGNNVYVVNWENDGKEMLEYAAKLYGSPTRTIKNIAYYFQGGMTWGTITSGKLSMRHSPVGFIPEHAGGMIPLLHWGEKEEYLLGMMNSNTAMLFLSFLSPTLRFTEGPVGLVPILYDKRYCGNIAHIVKNCESDSILDWDSFETSWDFRHHPLLRKVPTIAEAFEQWQAECDNRFNQLKANEEELNRIFIDIYGLQDELTPEVEDKDVTVRKADLGRDIRSFISYAVGCMFGRYSLDVDGLTYAGGEWDDSKYTSFAADKDNIIPICDDEYFEDDIVGLFVEFVKTVYGADTLDENLKFIADALGGKGQPKDVIRNYFLNDFYKDHCKIYQKRPIYWLFDSGKKNGFKALIYMHRYQPDTIARIRTDYVHEQQARYRTAIADLEQRIANTSTGERVKLNKKLTTLQAQDTEIRTYEEKIHHLADQMISIDLDDGVKKNYAIFQDVLAKIK